MDWLKEKNNLEEAINNGESYASLGRKYNVSGTYIKRIAIDLGINLTPRRKINSSETFNRNIPRVPIVNCLNCGKEFYKYSSSTGKYCSNKCQQAYQLKLAYQKIIDGDPLVMRANYSPRPFKKIIIEEQNGVCAICGQAQEWNGKPLVFILDHIDGHASNNKRDNLRCICPNCDSQLDTYKSKNKNGDRHFYRYHKVKKVP